MVTQLPTSSQAEAIYPDSDGNPMADNTKQFRWIVVLQQNLDWLFADDPNVFVAGDLLWYPVEGSPTIRIAPDVLVVFGRPKGDRGSYQQWKEEGIAPQVVFEVRSPGNSQTEMDKKLLFYDRYGVEEYYLYDPDKNDLSGWLRSSESSTKSLHLDVIDPITNWVSPRLGIRFDNSGAELQVYRPDGEPFASYVQISEQLQRERQRTEQERQRAEQERQRAEQERQRAEQAEARAQLLAERLKAAGIDPDDLQ
jgi:Uma2 family endonuclease